jgi:hypothetical protein
MDHAAQGGKSFGMISDDPAIRKAWLKGYRAGWHLRHGRQRQYG